MGWEVFEERIFPKDPKKGSEDTDVFTSKRCFAVLDGHTNDTTHTINGMSHGQFIVKAGMAAFEKYEDSHPRELIQNLTKHVEREMRAANIPWEKRPGFVFVAFLPERNVIIRVGDCQYFIDGVNEPFSNTGLIVDRVKSEVRAQMLQKLLETQSIDELLANDPTRPFMAHMKLWQHTYRNDRDPHFGYGVIDGSTVPTQKIEYIDVPRTARLIILTSDGYPAHVVRETVEDTERELFALLKRDPLCFREWIAVRGIGGGLERPDDCTYLSIVRS